VLSRRATEGRDRRRRATQWTFVLLLTTAMAVLGSAFSAVLPRASGVGPERALTVFAATSLTDVLPQVAASWRERGGTPILFSFDASSRLARQIASGAPADLFWSADDIWMDELQLRSRLDMTTRTRVLGNRLVVVVPASASLAPASARDLVAPRLAHLVLAGEDVPAGRYAEMAFVRLGVWEAVRGRVVRADNVRAALAWVARGDAEAGVVFATDARVERRVRVAFVFPDSSHPRIAYSAAVVGRTAQADAAARFLEFCHGPEARRLFTAAGFEVLGPDRVGGPCWRGDTPP